MNPPGSVSADHINGGARCVSAPQRRWPWEAPLCCCWEKLACVRARELFRVETFHLDTTRRLHGAVASFLQAQPSGTRAERDVTPDDSAAQSSETPALPRPRWERTGVPGWQWQASSGEPACFYFSVSPQDSRPCLIDLSRPPEQGLTGAVGGRAQVGPRGEWGWGATSGVQMCISGTAVSQYPVQRCPRCVRCCCLSVGRYLSDLTVTSTNELLHGVIKEIPWPSGCCRDAGTWGWCTNDPFPGEVALGTGSTLCAPSCGAPASLGPSWSCNLYQSHFQKLPTSTQDIRASEANRTDSSQNATTVHGNSSGEMVPCLFHLLPGRRSRSTAPGTVTAVLGLPGPPGPLPACSASLTRPALNTE